MAGAAGALGLLGILWGVLVLLRPLLSGAASAQDEIAALRARAEQSQAQVQALHGQLAASDAELAVERAARRALEANLATLQEQAGQLRDRLAFYDQLFPAGPAGTVSIRAAEIARVAGGLQYRVLLMRSARPGSPPFTGHLRFVATGTRDGAETRQALAPLPDPGAGADGDGGDPPSLIPLQVDQYRSSVGVLAPPPDFTPSEVTVEVVQDGNVQASQQAVVAF